MNISTQQFVAGWLAGMRQLSAQPIEIIRIEINQAKPYHVKDWYLGYIASLDHFDGLVSKYTEHAYDLGLVELYVDYYGQSNFIHPTLKDILTTYKTSEVC